MGGCTVGPTPGACAGAEGAEVAGIRVVALWGERVGYLRTAEPAAFPAFDDELPILGSFGYGEWGKCGC
jgi:hypothetical protein